jgi:hypothetical protein
MHRIQYKKNAHILRERDRSERDQREKEVERVGERDGVREREGGGRGGRLEGKSEHLVEMGETSDNLIKKAKK